MEHNMPKGSNYLRFEDGTGVGARGVEHIIYDDIFCSIAVVSASEFYLAPMWNHPPQTLLQRLKI